MKSIRNPDMTIVKKKAIKRQTDAPIQLESVSSIEPTMAALFYGRAGTGKTTVASTFPKPVLLLDVREKGWDSVSNVEELDVGRIEEWEEFEGMYWYLEKGNHPYKTVVIDQVTELQDLALKKALRDVGKDPNDKISQSNFGQASGLMKQWLRNYRDLTERGIHVVFIGHERITGGEENDDDQIDPSVGPRLMPSLQSFLCGLVKVVGHTFIRETTEIENKRKVRKISYAMRVGPHSFYITKMRTPVGVPTPRILVDPTYDKVAAVMQGEYSEAATQVKKVTKHGN